MCCAVTISFVAIERKKIHEEIVVMNGFFFRARRRKHNLKMNEKQIHIIFFIESHIIFENETQTKPIELSRCENVHICNIISANR